MEQKKKVRVVVRQWIPRKTSPVPLEIVRKFIQTQYPKLQEVLYVGWARKTLGGKKIIQLIAATGKTGLEARIAFKTSQNFGENVWILTL